MPGESSSAASIGDQAGQVAGSLIYHFGSKEGLLVEVIKLVEQRQRAALAELEFDAGLSAPAITRAFWRAR